MIAKITLQDLTIANTNNITHRNYLKKINHQMLLFTKELSEMFFDLRIIDNGTKFH